MTSPIRQKPIDDVNFKSDIAKESTKKEPLISLPSNWRPLSGEESAAFTARAKIPEKSHFFVRIWELFKRIFFPTELDTQKAQLKDLMSQSGQLLNEYEKLSSETRRLETLLYSGKSTFDRVRESGKGLTELDRKEKREFERISHKRESAYQQLLVNKDQIRRLSDNRPETLQILVTIGKLEEKHQIDGHLSDLMQILYEAGSRAQSADYQKKIRPILQQLVSKIIDHQTKTGMPGRIGSPDQITQLPIQLKSFFSSEFPDLAAKAATVLDAIINPAFGALLMEEIRVKNKSIPQEPTQEQTNFRPPLPRLAPKPFHTIPPSPANETPQPPPEPPRIPPVPKISRPTPPKEPPSPIDF